VRRLVSIWTFGPDAVEDVLFERISILVSFCVFESFHEVCLFLRNDLLVARDLVFFEFLGNYVFVVLNASFYVFLYLVMLDFKRLSDLFILLLYS